MQVEYVSLKLCSDLCGQCDLLETVGEVLGADLDSLRLGPPAPSLPHPSSRYGGLMVRQHEWPRSS